ncbi:hypothetical protein T484DRAFT_1744567 [Baffinella frigidus]|nr:hypothetical protein T484DRAFT_1744567 [Cryptophyta sp. CCMP2293]
MDPATPDIAPPKSASQPNPMKKTKSAKKSKPTPPQSVPLKQPPAEFVQQNPVEKSKQRPTTQPTPLQNPTQSNPAPHPKPTTPPPTPATLKQPQAEFVHNFLSIDQLQRMLIYFSKQRPTDPFSSYGFTDVVARLINDPLNIVFGQHGIYLFTNHLLVYPYNELDEAQVSYITNFLRTHVVNLPPPDATIGLQGIPSMKLDVRVSKQMGGGYTVRPVQLSNIRINTLDVLYALVRGVVTGPLDAKYNLQYRRHAVNLHLQRIVTKVVVSRAQLQAVNAELQRCQDLMC